MSVELLLTVEQGQARHGTLKGWECLSWPGCPGCLFSHIDPSTLNRGVVGLAGISGSRCGCICERLHFSAEMTLLTTHVRTDGSGSASNNQI